MDWVAHTRAKLTADGRWRPTISIQGGGAKGAWEAGVLAGLLGAKELVEPVCYWGTSAGAINSYWASTNGVRQQPDRLLANWLALSRNVMAVCLTGVALGFAFLILVVWMSIITGHYLAFLLAGLGILLLPVCWSATGLLRRDPRRRMRAPIPIWLASRFVPPADGPALCHTYFCTANVGIAAPVEWDFQTLGIFHTKPGADRCTLLTGSQETTIDRRIATMASAALPIASKPLHFAGDDWLDGGLEANLPAGHLRSQGAMGGNCAFLIIPRPLSALNPSDHFDYRTLRLLHSVCADQAGARASSQLAANDVHSRRALTQVPILVISPRVELVSGLAGGFLWPALLRREYQLGREQGRALVDALTRFQQDSAALDGLLLENQSMQEVGGTPPRPGFWACWVNYYWRHPQVVREHLK